MVIATSFQWCEAIAMQLLPILKLIVNTFYFIGGSRVKLELFKFIEESLNLIDRNSEVLDRVASELENFFTNSFFIKDHFLNVNYRIKSPESLKEKILRHNMYIIYSSPEELVENLSDLIGFRIECRFISDEKKVYNEIVELFKYPEENGYYSNPLNSNIMLKLDEKQPQIQKNGFEIYKIDGKYSKEGVVVNFELQIKSLVNVFWGDIDHRVLYKNFNYMITEDFFRDIMSSIKDSLGMIDRQLMLVYNHLNEMDASNKDAKKEQLKALLSKMIHDIYIVKVKQELGFVVDFKKSTDVIVDYIFKKSGDEDSLSYSNNFIKIVNRLNEVVRDDITFDNYLEFDRELNFPDEKSEKLGNIILKVINKDFKWNLFFKILFDIELGSNSDDFECFVVFLLDRLENEIKRQVDINIFNEEDRYKMEDEYREFVFNNFAKKTDIDLISICHIRDLFEQNY
ncbi:hypothetical protein E9840_06820 [Tissierella creatinini]|nr:hypothetical protein E9840_06820 [Tissierella creatinini]TJX61887.1 hypothetical protein E8P77_17910 [Soehngenia saccharolytica]